MSSRALQSLIRPAFRQSACVVCRPSTRLQSPPPAVAAASRTYAKKAKSGSSAHHKKGSSSKAVEEQQNVVAAAKGKKGKGKGGFLDTDPDAMVETVAADEVGVYDLKILETEMDNAIERLRVGLKSVVGRVGRVSPGEFFYHVGSEFSALSLNERILETSMTVLLACSATGPRASRSGRRTGQATAERIRDRDR